jgi:hypothetical protein
MAEEEGNEGPETLEGDEAYVGYVQRQRVRP